MCSNSKTINETDTVYMVLTDRFFDGNAANNGVLGEEYRPGDLRYYQGGDWAGLREKLPYIRALGFTAIWMSPPQDNERYSRLQDEAGYHGYYTRDYYHPNSHFGTEDDLRKLFVTADSLGLKIILDAQLNHMADYLDYPSQDYNPPEYRPAPPFDNPAWFHNTPNIVDFDNPDELQNNSLGGLDDLAQENPDCWAALLRAYWNPNERSGWMSYGFAASRIDVALQVPPEYLRRYQEHTGKPCFGEALTSSVDRVASLQSYICGALDYPLYYAIDHAIALGNGWERVQHVLGQDGKYRDPRKLLTFIDNHDRARFLANCGGDVRRLRLALTFLFMVRGIPVVYYGTEQALDGDKQYCDENENEANREMMPYFDIDTPIAQWIANLNRLRVNHSASLCLGGQEEIYCRSGDPVYAFSRHTPNKEQELICVFNASPVRQNRTLLLDAAPYRAEGTRLINLLDRRQSLYYQRYENGVCLCLELEPMDAMVLQG